MKKGQCRVAYLAAAAIIAGFASVSGSASIAAENSPTSTETSAVNAGSEALQRGAFDEAVTQYTSALDSERLPRETIAITYLNRGLAFQRLGQLVEAIADYDYALQQNALTPPIRAIALYNRGLANRRLYRTTLALEDFTNALILNPRFAHAYNSRGNVLRELGYYTTAIEDYDAAIRYQHPSIHIPLYGKALAHAALNDIDSAQRSLARALQTNPDYEPALTLLARLNAAPASAPTASDDTTIADRGDIETGTVTAQTEIPRTPSPFEGQTSGEGRTAQLAEEDQQVVASPAGGPDPQIAAAEVAAAEAAAATASDADQSRSPSFAPGPGFEETLGREDSLSPTAEATPEETITTASATPATGPAEAREVPDGYMVQLSAQRERDAASDVWSQLSEDNADILDGVTPYIIETDLGTRGIFYRLRAGVFTSRDEGENLCRKLKSRRVDCYVISSGS